MKYFPLHCHSHYSLLDGLSKPAAIASRITNLDLDGCAISDHGNLAGTVQFYKAMKKAGKKSLLGCELYLSNKSATDQSPDNRKLFHQVVIAKDLAGWKNLIKVTSDANSPDRFYHRPRVDFKYFEEHGTAGLMSFSGHLGSYLSNVLLNGDQLHSDWRNRGISAGEYLRDLFGSDKFYIEIQLIDSQSNQLAKTVGECLREISKVTGIPRVATADSHYTSRQDAEDQRILLCNNLHVTLGQVKAQLESDEDVGLGCFFKSTNFHIPSYDEMKVFHTDDELENTIKFAEACSSYDILGKPILPQFSCPNDLNPDAYLRQLCGDGWKSKILNKVDKSKHQEYADRVKYELSVLQGAGLSSYFLIVQDIIQFVRSNGWLPGPGRGSAAGCLVSYLIGITSIDPLPYDLIFERFYNAGRNTADRVSMPDIDMDVPVGKREQVIDYIKNKYGHDRVSQMVTFQTMKGRGAIKSVFRAHGNMSFDEMNRITEFIPDEAKIADELQEMKEETGESSIIRWSLENHADKLRDWCFIDEQGKLQGPLAKRFEQAIRLEGTKTEQSKHAAGVVISPTPLNETCPMILDSKNKSHALIAGLEMADLEDLGMIKFDVLGVAFLDKIMGVVDILKTGKMKT